jgi:squalene-associated FAD-dependent desaturase
VADVLVIGGGFAGLSAATWLAERGRRVAVLEARPALGGRAAAFTDPATGERVDNGQHVVFGCYHETLAFLRRIGMASRVTLQSGLTIHVIDREGRHSTLACPPLPAPLHLIAGIARWRALGWGDRAAAVRIGSAVRRSRPADVDGGMTVREWLTRAGQTPRLIELLWEPLAVAALNQPIDTAAAAPFAEVLRRMFGTDRRDSAVGIPSVPLDDLYAAPSRAFVERRGGTVTTGEPARIVGEGRDGWCVRVRDGERHARAVVCAVPWHALPEVLPPLPGLAAIAEAARATPPSPIVTVNLWLDRQVAPGAFVGLPGRHMQWLFDKGRLIGAGSSHLSLVSSGAASIAGLSNDALTALALDEVRSALPDARRAALRRAVVVRERRATFSLAPGMPARPPVATGLPGLFLAGDWVDTGLPATIESAVSSGHAAAAAAWPLGR